MGNRSTNNKYSGIKAASKSSVEISFNYEGVRCRERVKCKPTDSNFRKLSIFRDKILASIENETFDYISTFPDSTNPKLAKVKSTVQLLTVKKHLEKWLEDQKNYLKASTLNGYRKIIVHRLIPALGNISLKDLSLKNVKDFTKTIKDVDTKTIGNIISPLRCALDEAVEDDLIEVNPIDNLKIKRRKKDVKKSNKKENISPFAFDEREAIINSLSGQNKNLVRFIFWTGLRTSEFIALDWSDIDWGKKTVSINKALTQASKEAETTKTDAGIRVIKLLPEAYAALKDQKKHTIKIDKKTKKEIGKEIFQNPKTGERWTGDQAIRKTMWKPALKRAGVEYRYPYQTRHTFASMMLTDGEQIHWLSKQMGHTDWSFTARTYAKYIEADDCGAGSKATEAQVKRKKKAEAKKSKHDEDELAGP